MNNSLAILKILLFCSLITNYSSVFAQYKTTDEGKKQFFKKIEIKKLKSEGKSDRYIEAYNLFSNSEYNLSIKNLMPLETMSESELALTAKNFYYLENYDSVKVTLWNYFEKFKPKVYINHLGSNVNYPTEYQNCNVVMALSHYFTNDSDADSAIIYINRAIDSPIFDPELYSMRGVFFSINDFKDKACSDFFISMNLGIESAKEFYDDTNCESWKETWINKNYGEFEIDSKKYHDSYKFFKNVKYEMAIGKNYVLKKSDKNELVMLVKMFDFNFGTLFVFNDQSKRKIYTWYYEWQEKREWEVSLH